MESALIFYHVKNYMLVNNLFDLLTFLFFLYSIKQLVSVAFENYVELLIKSQRTLTLTCKQAR
jgi:hypothetical protein